MSMWSLRWHFTNKSVAGAPYSIKGYSYSLSHSRTLWWRVRWLKQCRQCRTTRAASIIFGRKRCAFKMSKFFVSRTGVLTAQKSRRLEERQLEVQLPLQSTCCSYSRPCLLNTHTQCAHAGLSSSRPGRQQPAPHRCHDTSTTDSKTNKLSPRPQDCVTKGRLGSGQGCNERKVSGRGVCSGCGVTRRRRWFTVMC